MTQCIINSFIFQNKTVKKNNTHIPLRFFVLSIGHKCRNPEVTFTAEKKKEKQKFTLWIWLSGGLIPARRQIDGLKQKVYFWNVKSAYSDPNTPTSVHFDQSLP